MAGRASRRRGVLIAGIAAVALAIGLAAGAQAPLPGQPGPRPGGSSPPEATLAHSSTWPARRDALAAVLTRRSAALTARDKAAWMATLADPSSPFGQRQAAAYDLLVDLGVTRLDADPLAEASVAEATWGARVAQRFQLPGFDREPRRWTTTMSVSDTPDGPRLADDSASDSARQLFELPGAEVVRGEGVLVVGDQPPTVLAAYRELALVARQHVQARWGSCPPVVLVAPASVQAAAAQLGGTGSAGQGEVAATTDGSYGPEGFAVADRVVLDPLAMGRLTPAGRRAVVTHEVVHVAVRARTNAPVPLWLSEGYAEHVGMSAAGVDVVAGTAELRERVAVGGEPTFPPTDDDLAIPGARATAYQAARVVVARLVDRYGWQRVADVYRRAATAPPAGPPGAGAPAPPGPVSAVDPSARTRQALADILGITETEISADTASWFRDAVLAPAGSS